MLAALESLVEVASTTRLLDQLLQERGDLVELRHNPDRLLALAVGKYVQTMADREDAFAETVDAVAKHADAFAETVHAITEQADAFAETVHAITEHADAFTETIHAPRECVDGAAHRIDALP